MTDPREFLFEYHYDGETWCITIKAKDAADAIARSKRLTWVTYQGEIFEEGSVASPRFPLAILKVWWRNQRKRISTA